MLSRGSRTPTPRSSCLRKSFLSETVFWRPTDIGRYENSGLGVGTKGNPQQSLEQENFAQKNNDISSAMPNYDKATIDDKKFLGYSLNKNHPVGKHKAIAYEQGLGFNQSNYNLLKQQIHDKINGGTAKLTHIENTSYGTKYTFELPIKGSNGKTKTVIVVYQIDKGGSIPRLVTNYLK